MSTDPPVNERATRNPDSGRTAVAVIGLGLMGGALARAFLRAGHPTTVWNRTAAKADGLVAQGAEPADSAGAAIASSPLVVICVSDNDAVRGLLEPLSGVAAGRVVVNLTSGTSAQARETAEWARREGAAYLDGAIMAAPEAIGTGDATIAYSGPRPAFDRHEPALRVLGAATHLGADPGLSSLHEAAVMGLMWNILNGFLHGAALLGSAGVDAAAFTRIAVEGIGTVTGWLPGLARQVDEGTYPAPDSTIDTHLAAMDHLIHESEAHGVSAELPRFIKALADRAVADGHGGDGYAAMVERFRASSGART
ncbi:NAD(P)-dependent oxidoreductase [Nocardiopsis mangrovi]|uniref:NAD(P)-dependent oxidoreductase n=1 Tax=Nocardiopsis mangrovi TaxID=1179818 RepID=A0ABV9E1N8_9ACTN